MPVVNITEDKDNSSQYAVIVDGKKECYIALNEKDMKWRVYDLSDNVITDYEPETFRNDLIEVVTLMIEERLD